MIKTSYIGLVLSLNIIRFDFTIFSLAPFFFPNNMRYILQFLLQNFLEMFLIYLKE